MKKKARKKRNKHKQVMTFMRQFKRCDRILDTLDKRGFDPFSCFYVVQINHSFFTDAKPQDQPRENKKNRGCIGGSECDKID